MAMNIEKLKSTIDKLRSELEELGVKGYDRQHGRAGIAREGIDELVRIRNNLASQVYRAKKRNTIKDIHAKITSKDALEVDDSGITIIDERRYRACFMYENIAPDLDYVMRMTGCSLEEIKQLEKKTGLICYHSRVEA